ncbi:MAG: DUF2608 domain-containing protein, partial [Puniceicoccales bacterium]|nr:DUF2608 domain-containing protein [Puniceicoccales bacterium]
LYSSIFHFGCIFSDASIFFSDLLAPVFENSDSTNSQSLILELTPKDTISKLQELNKNGTINTNTGIVWDLDETLFQSSSDQKPSGAIPIHPEFSKYIKTTQEQGIRHFGLTNNSQYKNIATIDSQQDKLVINSEPINICAEHKNCLIFGKPEKWNFLKDTDISYEGLRIKGLKDIGIDFDDSRLSTIPQHLGILVERYVQSDNNSVRTVDMKKMFRDSIKNVTQNPYKTVGQFNDFRTGERYQYIQAEYIRKYAQIQSSENPQTYHFICNEKNSEDINEILCVPIFSKGIIFCNFLNKNLSAWFAYRKGDILELFLKIHEEKTGQEIGNVIFVDDQIANVQNVVEVMTRIGKPCIGIHLIPESPLPVESHTPSEKKTE